MDSKKFEVNMDINGSNLIIETGKIARQAHGSVLVKCGETTILATAVFSKRRSEYMGFFPLTVDYVEKFYASGKIPGGFYKRESKPSVQSTLKARLIDRAIRPNFPKEFSTEVHVVINVLSYDKKNDPAWLGIVGASAALIISDVPFFLPIAGIDVSLVNEQFIANPSPEEKKLSRLNITVAGTEKKVTMLECDASEANEKQVVEGIKFAQTYIKKLTDIQNVLESMAGKAKLEVVKNEIPIAILEIMNEIEQAKLKALIFEKDDIDKVGRIDQNLRRIERELESSLGVEVSDIFLKKLEHYYYDYVRSIARSYVLEHDRRVDGRNIDEVRKITIDVDVLPITHGSAIFTRGETQALGVTTLGTTEDEQIIDTLNEDFRQRFFLHYNFPQFSVGEIGSSRAPGRRELGHGALAEKAISYVIPTEDKFPYTIRVVSDILESSGSTSMASVCAASLSLMAAGVPIKKHVSGVAMGLIKEGDKYVILTDISGFEDRTGDMDFKVAGTRDGITALQLDIKIDGLTLDIIEKTLERALHDRTVILDKMEKVMSCNREEVKENVPRCTILEIDKDKISTLIGPAGKNIKKIVEESDSKIDISDDGKVKIFCSSADKLECALNLIKKLTKTVAVGEIVEGQLKNSTRQGAFVDLGGSSEGFLNFTDSTRHLKKGDKVVVKVLSINESGKMVLTTLEDEKAGLSVEPRKERKERKEVDLSKITKFNVGDMIEGKIKNITRHGVFVSLDDDFEGFLPLSESDSKTLVREGKMKVKIKSISEEGKIRLSSNFGRRFNDHSDKRKFNDHSDKRKYNHSEEDR